MRRLRALVSLVVVGAALGLAAGCVDSDDQAARTPEAAATVVNTAVQTDEEGQTIDAPVSPPEATPDPTEPAQQTPGDTGAGQQVFAANCESCHASGGEAAGVGPVLAGQGLDDGAIRQAVDQGPGAMPPGLVSGEELDDVVAYVLGIQ